MDDAKNVRQTDEGVGHTSPALVVDQDERNLVRMEIDCQRRDSSVCKRLALARSDHTCDETVRTVRSLMKVNDQRLIARAHANGSGKRPLDRRAALPTLERAKILYLLDLRNSQQGNRVRYLSRA